MRYAVGCELGYRVFKPTVFLFNIEAAATSTQTLSDERLTLPEGPLDRWTMPESGNRYLRLRAAPGDITIGYDAVIDFNPRLLDPAAIGQIPPGELPFWVIPFLFPSRYCQSDKLENIARGEFLNLPPGHARVAGICNWICDKIAYRRGASNAETSALETLTARNGVCRDFAHLGIALCRALGIPARFVSAYARDLQPPDFHGVFEAYLQGGWYLFDATRQAPLDAITRIGVGRDAADVSFATILGESMPTEMKVWMNPLEPTSTAERTISGVAISD